MPTMTVLLAEVYVADESIREEGTDALDPYWLEGVPARVEVCAEDGQIRLGVTLDDVYSEVVGLYLDPSSARDLLVGLGAAIKDFESRSVR